jgi:hypothetical protein
MLTSLPKEGRMDRLEGIKIFVRVVESGSFWSGEGFFFCGHRGEMLLS